MELQLTTVIRKTAVRLFLLVDKGVATYQQGNEVKEFDMVVHLLFIHYIILK